MPCGSLLIPCSAFGGLTPFSGAFATLPAVFWTLPVVLWRAPDAPFVVELRVLVACLPVDFTMSGEGCGLVKGNRGCGEYMMDGES